MKDDAEVMRALIAEETLVNDFNVERKLVNGIIVNEGGQRVGLPKENLENWKIKDEIPKGALCYFWNHPKDKNKIAGVFKCNEENLFVDLLGDHWKHCRPLTKAELQVFIELAPE